MPSSAWKPLHGWIAASSSNHGADTGDAANRSRAGGCGWQCGIVALE